MRESASEPVAHKHPDGESSAGFLPLKYIGFPLILEQGEEAAVTGTGEEGREWKPGRCGLKRRPGGFSALKPKLKLNFKILNFKI